MTGLNPRRVEGIQGDWHWREASGTLAVSADGDLSFLSGQWDLSAFSLQLEGLSRARLHRTFYPRGFPKAEKDGVRCPLILSDGRRIELMGMYTSPGEAKGRLVKPVSEAKRAADTQPGPGAAEQLQFSDSNKQQRLAALEREQPFSGLESIFGSGLSVDTLWDDSTGINNRTQLASG